MSAQKTSTEAFKRPRERSPRPQDQEQEPGLSRRDPWGDGSGDGQARGSQPEVRPFPPIPSRVDQARPTGSMDVDEDRGFSSTEENYRRFMRSLQEDLNSRPGLAEKAKSGTVTANEEMRSESTRRAETSSSTSSSSLSTVPAHANSTPRGNPVGREDGQLR